MSSSTTPQALKPFYTREMFYEIEASLATDGEYIEVKNHDGKSFQTKNPHRGLGTGDLAPGTTQRRNIVLFQDERSLKSLEAQGKRDYFFPACNGSTVIHGATRSEEETRSMFVEVTQTFNTSDEAAAITNLIHTHLSGCTVNKVIAFGLGRIGHVWRGPPKTFYEHAAALVVRRAVQDVSSAPKVSLLIQDPLYTNVCKKVLQEHDFDVIEGFGAKGFALVDDDTVVLAHHPAFPLRELIADIARPALISMMMVEDQPINSQGIPDVRWDINSVRSRKMLEEYDAFSLLVPIQVAFWDNAWFIRKTDKNQNEPTDIA
ncbi:hypothetical protein EV127DRAFT_426363 [Xylaria flabelliformis]|nr:hypothetical protein EV127DRAFT_426363 [Xylaria flabelliformis]